MKKNILFKTFALFAAVAMLFSCKEPFVQVLSLSDSAVNFAADANLDKTVTVTCNSAWSASCDADWVTITPKSGENDGTIKIAAAENTSFTERSTEVKVVAGEMTQTVKVAQVAATPTLGVVPEAIDFAAEGGSQTFTITTNAAWTVTCNADEWFNVTPTSGNGNGTVTVTAAANAEFEVHAADITVVAEDLHQVIQVSQAAAVPSISVDFESVVFTREGGNFTVEVTSNTAWILGYPFTRASSTYLNDWLAASDIAGEAGTTRVSFYASENAFLQGRDLTVYFVATVNGNETEFIAPVTITQDAGLPSRFTDSLALVAIYNAANGASWKEDRVWDLSKPINEWYGVTLTNNRVSALKILAKTISTEWTMPEEIGDLTELTDLRFNSACVAGDFMESLYKLTKLVSLYFQTNNISGSFSEKVAVWTELKDLYINDNANFGGTLPKEFGQLKKLANINIAKTSIGGAVPAEFSSCDALVNFMVYSTKLTSLPDNFDQWPALKILQVYDIPTLTGPLPASVGNCKKVTSVWLHTCNFEGNIPESYANLPATCTQLRIMNNKLSGTVPAAVKAHANWTAKWNPAQYILPQQEGYGLTE